MKLLTTLICLSFLFSFSGLRAQSTNPAPYCYPLAPGMTAGTCTGTGSANGFGFGLKYVSLNKISQSSGCYGSSNADVYRYWSATTSLNVNVSYVMTVQSQQASGKNQVGLGVWIDFDQSNTFDSSELLISSLYNTYGNQGGFYIYIPCTAKAGKTRMRVRSQGYRKITGRDSCKAQSGYGETWDFDVTIVQPISVSADFNLPYQQFNKTEAKFSHFLPYNSGYSNYAWDANNDGTYESVGNQSQFNYTWNTTGTKCVKLRARNCYGSDSVVKCLSVVAPTAKPQADFVSCDRIFKVYGVSTLQDMSSNGPYKWEWNIYDSITYKNDKYDKVANEQSGDVYYNGGISKYSKNPQVSFYRDGNYTVELKATNDSGTAFMKKQFYIWVNTKDEIYDYLRLGAIYGKTNENIISNSYGKVMDWGGETNNYNNNAGVKQSSYLGIHPPLIKPISVVFRQIKLAPGGDTIKIFDDDTINNSKILGIITASQNGTYPVFTSSTNKLYFLFVSDSSGTDSGFVAEFSNTGLIKRGFSNITIGNKILYLNENSAFYNEQANEYRHEMDRIWSVNDTIQPKFYNLDTLIYKFTNAKNQKVCLELRSCDTTIKTCKTLTFASGVKGTVFKDNNNSCAMDSGDNFLARIPLKLYDSTLNQWSYYLSDAGGEYNVSRGYGGYKIMVDTAGYPFSVKCSNPGVDSGFSLKSTDPLKKINFNVDCKAGFDVGFRLAAIRGILRPGANSILRISAGHMNKRFGLNCAPNLSGNLIVTISGKVSYLQPDTGYPVPSSVSGNKIIYDIPNFSKIKEYGSFSDFAGFGLLFKTDSTAKTGDTVKITFRVTPVNGDTDTTNNTFVWIVRVNVSMDPNIKEVYPAEVTEGFKDWLTYTIHFQNTGKTPAYDIRVADTLSSLLDPQTFQLLDYSHPVATTLTNNILSFDFKNILLPDSASDEAASKGYVKYRIRPKNSLTKGTKVENKAFIYFDYNAPVVTNTATNIVLPHLVFIPDPAFAAWLTARYPSCMYKVNWMDTSCSDIKNETSVNVAARGIADLFGIQFFTSLKTLNCSGNLLITLPAVSAGVTHINCLGNKITGLPALPVALQVLRCDNNELSALPVLPATINYLSCAGNKLKNLPALPAALENLYCDRNQLSGLPALPGALKSLSCIDNSIAMLPALPAALSVIVCDSNRLDTLPALPTSVTVLSCEYNQLTQLPVLPSALSQLYCNNNKIICFEKFAESIGAIKILPNSNKCVPNYIASMDAATKAVPLCIAGDKVNNPDNCPGKPLTDVRKVTGGRQDAVVYPNPGNGIYHVALPQAGECDIEVFDALGVLVYKAHQTEREFLLDLSGASNGVYMLRISGTDGSQVICLLKS